MTRTSVGSFFLRVTVYSFAGLAASGAVFLALQKFSGGSPSQSAHGPAPTSHPAIEWDEDAPHPALPPEPKKVLKPVLVQRFWYDCSTYTPTSDGWKPSRQFANKNFMPGGAHYNQGRPYPKKFTFMRNAMQGQWSVVAVPWDEKWIHEELMEHKPGVWFHKYVVRVPARDPEGVYRIPLDRCPKWIKRNGISHRLRRFDLLEYISDREAMKKGVPFLPVEVYELKWVDP